MRTHAISMPCPVGSSCCTCEDKPTDCEADTSFLTADELSARVTWEAAQSDGWTSVPACWRTLVGAHGNGDDGCACTTHEAKGGVARDSDGGCKSPHACSFAYACACAYTYVTTRTRECIHPSMYAHLYTSASMCLNTCVPVSAFM